MDMPEIEAIIVENPDSFGPYGAKTIGEPTPGDDGPAIASAVAQATGRRVRQLPLDLERCCWAVPCNKTVIRGGKADVRV